MTDEYEPLEEGLDISWEMVERPGYFGKRRQELEEEWNRKYGEGNWRLVWETPQGRVLLFEDIIWEYIEGYAGYFRRHPREARHITRSYSYCYDKDEITKDQAFHPYALYNRPGIANQFHHAAMNIALENVLGMPFRGDIPIQVRSGKPGTPESQWPAGWKWSPGRIPSVHRDEIHDITFERQWWQRGTIEDFYQCNKVLQVKIS